MRLQLKFGPRFVRSFGRGASALVGALLILAPMARAMAADAEEESEEKKDEPKEEEKKPAPRKHTSPSSTVVKASLETSTYIDTDHVFVMTPTIGASVESPTGGWSLNGRYLLDAVSAASVDIVSTATKRWNEVRHAGSLGFGYKPSDFGFNLGAYVSSEPDYLSLTGAGTLTWELDQKNITLTAGYSYGHDIEGVHFTPFSVFSHVIDKHSALATVGFLVDRSTTIGFVADGMIERGDQSKPYRYVPMFQADVAASIPKGASVDLVNQLRLPERPREHLPLARDRYALTTKLAHRYTDSTLRLDERLYADSWGAMASTTDMRWIIDAGARFMVWPHLRFHGQSEVKFWKRAYVSTRTPGGDWAIPEYRTGDRELGPLIAATAGGGFKIGIGSKADPMSWSIALTADGNWTSYLDDIYLNGRASFFGALTLEGEL